MMKTLVSLAVVAAIGACNKNQEGKASLPERNEAATVGTESAAGLTTSEAVTPAESGAPATVDSAVGTQATDAVEAAPPPAESAPTAASPSPADSRTVRLRLTGQVTSQRASKLAFKQGGFVAQTIAKPGSIVKKDEILASLEDEDFALRLELAKANRDLAKVSQENARKELDRELQLKKDNASTGAVLDKVQAAFDQARLQLRLAEIEATLAERALADTKLRAPYDCVVAVQAKYEGENVQPGAIAYEVYDLADPEITFEAPERLMGKLAIGDRLDVVIPSSGFSGKAEIVRVVPVIAEKTRTFRVIARPGRADGIVPGSFAEATLN